MRVLKSLRTLQSQHRVPVLASSTLRNWQSPKIFPFSAFSSSSFSTWKVAIVGSGPSGCYTAKYLDHAAPLGKTDHDDDSPALQIDIIDRLPTAYGLVRNGVAPDHPEVKNVKNDFDEWIEESRAPDSNRSVQFFGNVHVGQDVSLEELRKMYDIVVLAYGCESDRALSIPGSGELEGVLSARQFVAWYNGHVDYEWVGPIVEQALARGQGKENIVVLGHGNVALDCARIMAKVYDELDPTDIATRALNVIGSGEDDANGAPRHISIVGRRGHVQGAFTIKELRELTKLPHAKFVVRPDELEMGLSTEASQEEVKSRPRTRMDKLLTKAASAKVSDKKHQVDLRFLMNPIRLEPSPDDETKLGAVVCERTKLVGEVGQQSAEGTGEEEAIEAQLALVSIGYKGVAIDGTEPWFDDLRGVLKNTSGLVDEGTEELGGLYASGWLKRGPTGIIGTNIPDAKDTVATIVHHSKSGTPKQSDSSAPTLETLLTERGVQFVDWNAYQCIDNAEMSEEHKRHPEQPREKMTTTEELLQAAFGK